MTDEYEWPGRLIYNPGKGTLTWRREIMAKYEQASPKCNYDKAAKAGNMKVMDGIKQKPEARDMHVPVKMYKPEQISNK